MADAKSVDPDQTFISQEQASQNGAALLAAVGVTPFVERQQDDDPFKDIEPGGHLLVDSPAAIRERLRLEEEDELDAAEAGQFVQLKQRKIEERVELEGSKKRAEERAEAEADNEAEAILLAEERHENAKRRVEARRKETAKESKESDASTRGTKTPARA